jgi:A/G-specific adenine glycosylase
VAKKAKPQKYGAAFVVRRKDGAMLLVDRPDKGLLGGMTGVPTSEWIEAHVDEALLIENAPVKARWKKYDQPVTHVFTHFSLTLTVYFAEITQNVALKPPYRWSSANGPAGEALPTLFRKVIKAVS